MTHAKDNASFYPYQAKTPAERKREERERLKKLGLRAREFWVHDDDYEEIKALVDKLRAKRGAKVIKRKAR